MWFLVKESLYLLILLLLLITSRCYVCNRMYHIDWLEIKLVGSMDTAEWQEIKLAAKISELNLTRESKEKKLFIWLDQLKI